jgi:hypothetical protein
VPVIVAKPFCRHVIAAKPFCMHSMTTVRLPNEDDLVQKYTDNTPKTALGSWGSWGSRGCPVCPSCAATCTTRVCWAFRPMDRPVWRYPPGGCDCPWCGKVPALVAGKKALENGPCCHPYTRSKHVFDSHDNGMGLRLVMDILPRK